MSVYCPRTGKKVIYMTCMECDTRGCHSANEREYGKPMHYKSQNKEKNTSEEKEVKKDV